MNRKAILFLPSCFVAFALLLFLYPCSVPPLWFDEGWVLSVAKNWTQIGFYGEIVNGVSKPAAALNVGFPAIGLISASFKALGVGIWQGRLPGCILALGSIILMYALAQRLYSLPVARATLLVLLLLPGMSPILMGKQALGETYAIFFFLVGLACLLHFSRRPLTASSSATIFWSLASITKLQFLPFIFFALLTLCLLAMIHKRWPIVRLCTLLTIGTTLSFVTLFLFARYLVGGRFLSETGLYSGTALVFTPSVRLSAAITTLLYGLLTLLALTTELKRIFSVDLGFDSYKWIPSGMLWLVVASWMAWYVFSSIAWARYLYCPIFLGSMYVALFIMRTLFGSSFDSPYPNISHKLEPMPISAKRIAVVTVAVSYAIWNFTVLWNAFASGRDDSVLDVAKYLNSFTSRDALIETYEMDVIFLLQRPCHYPPDRIQLQLNRKVFQHEQVAIQYSPLDANPDYLVLGPRSRLWGLYNTVIAQGQFELLKTFSRYSVYKRIRSHLHQGAEAINAGRSPAYCCISLRPQGLPSILYCKFSITRGS